MSFWQIMNIAAWALSGIIGAWLLYDFIKIERNIKHNKSNH